MAINFKRGFSTFFRIKEVEHYPVMYREVHSLISDFLRHVERKHDEPRTYQMVDGTFGGGNHSVPLLT